jgi:hypothetical protein
VVVVVVVVPLLVLVLVVLGKEEARARVCAGKGGLWKVQVFEKGLLLFSLRA